MLIMLFKFGLFPFLFLVAEGINDYSRFNSRSVDVAAVQNRVIREVLVGKTQTQSQTQSGQSQRKLFAGRYRMNDMIKAYSNGFSWSSCSKAGDPSNLTSLSLSPDPVTIPGNITLSFSGELSVDLSTPIKLELTLKKKVVFWIEIPCVENIGSCTYDDVCALLESFKCPSVFKQHGIPCKCPVKAGKYSLPSSDIFVDAEGIPSFLESGDYKVEAKLSKGDQEITCINIALSIR